MRAIGYLPFCLALVSLHPPSRAADPVRKELFNWKDRLQLDKDQRTLLRLMKDAADPEKDSKDPVAIGKRIDTLKQILGARAVRQARPDELVLTQAGPQATAFINNPSAEALVFTVAIRDDTIQLGSRAGSVGRSTYLPPGGTLRVPDLYWTSPRMKKAD